MHNHHIFKNTYLILVVFPYPTLQVFAKARSNVYPCEYVYIHFECDLAICISSDNYLWDPKYEHASYHGKILKISLK